MVMLAIDVVGLSGKTYIKERNGSLNDKINDS